MCHYARNWIIFWARGGLQILWFSGFLLGHRILRVNHVRRLRGRINHVRRLRVFWIGHRILFGQLACLPTLGGCLPHLAGRFARHVESVGGAPSYSLLYTKTSGRSKTPFGPSARRIICTGFILSYPACFSAGSIIYFLLFVPGLLIVSFGYFFIYSWCWRIENGGPNLTQQMNPTYSED